MNKDKTYPPQSIGSIMTGEVPTCSPSSRLSDIFHDIAAHNWDSIRTVYVVDEDMKLLGHINLSSLAHADHDTQAKSILQPARDILSPYDDQEKAVFLSVKDNDIPLPVTDKDGVLLGAVTARRIISIMHEEHMEDILLASGIRHNTKGSTISKLTSERISWIVSTRAPWLIVGLVAGLGLGLISSLFETSLQETIALAYFIPVIAYIADSVGAQSVAIVVRALATLHINPWRYLAREIAIGISLGSMLGVLGGIGALAISQSVMIACVVGLSLLIASSLAAGLAVSIPFLFKAAGKDPALGSGPLATAIQDVASVLIYFCIATLLL